jgi:hypothetical protein
MTAEDNEIVAKVRASLQDAAGRTPIGPDRLPEFTTQTGTPDAAGRRGGSRTWLPVAASVAAVAVVAGIIVAARHDGRSAAGVGTAGQSPAAAVSSPAATSSAPTSPAVTSPVASPVVLPAPSVTAVAGACNPENYYVIAAPDQLTGMTYLLPKTPAGYEMYGAWGTISRNNCLDSATWYVEYDKVGDSSAPIQLRVSWSVDPTYNRLPNSVAVTVAGHAGWFMSKDASFGMVMWSLGGRIVIDLSGPIVGGKPDALVAVAEALIAVPVNDSRIVAPANCQVAPGNVCPSAPPTPNAGDAANSTPVPSATPYATAPATPIPTFGPTGG